MNFLWNIVLYSSFYGNQPLDDCLLSQYHLATNDGWYMKTIALCQNHMTYQVKVYYLILSNVRVIPHWDSCCIFSSRSVIALCCPMHSLSHSVLSSILAPPPHLQHLPLVLPLLPALLFLWKICCTCRSLKASGTSGYCPSIGVLLGGAGKKHPWLAQCCPVLQHPFPAGPAASTWKDCLEVGHW